VTLYNIAMISTRFLGIFSSVSVITSSSVSNCFWRKQWFPNCDWRTRSKGSHRKLHRLLAWRTGRQHFGITDKGSIALQRRFLFFNPKSEIRFYPSCLAFKTLHFLWN